MTRRVQVSGADLTLFHVAARELGDALQAPALAYASGLLDPWIDGMAVVTVPDAPAPALGGLPSPGLLP